MMIYHPLWRLDDDKSSFPASAGRGESFGQRQCSTLLDCFVALNRPCARQAYFLSAPWLTPSQWG
ncbi:hypothetical protein D3C78_436540 [compost metagenome]